jgi:hypothetical protein
MNAAFQKRAVRRIYAAAMSALRGTPESLAKRTARFFCPAFLPHECGVPKAGGTPHLCGSDVRPSWHARIMGETHGTMLLSGLSAA